MAKRHIKLSDYLLLFIGCILLGISVWEAIQRNARGKEVDTAKRTIGAIYNAAKLFDSSGEIFAQDVDELIEFGYLDIDSSVRISWTFTIFGYDSISAQSTDLNRIGKGWVVTYRIQQGIWSQLYQPVYVSPLSDQYKSKIDSLLRKETPIVRSRWRDRECIMEGLDKALLWLSEYEAVQQYLSTKLDDESDMVFLRAAWALIRTENQIVLPDRVVFRIINSNDSSEYLRLKAIEILAGSNNELNESHAIKTACIIYANMTLLEADKFIERRIENPENIVDLFEIVYNYNSTNAYTEMLRMKILRSFMRRENHREWFFAKVAGDSLSYQSIVASSLLEEFDKSDGMNEFLVNHVNSLLAGSDVTSILQITRKVRNTLNSNHYT
ncbi:hypothetical protein K8I28_15400, partial [bacterium]|nr:hypothetical protein [bacterium]